MRLLPDRIKGRAALGRGIYNLTIKYCDTLIDKDFMRLFKMHQGSLFYLDLRDNISIEPFYTGRYELFNNKVIKNILCNINQPVVLDIGANIGLVSVPIAKYIANRSGIVHAFEPLESNCKQLKINKDINKLNNIVIHPYALGDKDGEAMMGRSFKYNPIGAKTGSMAIIGDRTSELKIDSDEIFKARIKRLDDVYKDEKIDTCSLIKLDVEGYEIAGIKGGINFIKEYRPAIIGEFSSFWIKYNGYSMQEAYALLKPLGYMVYQIRKNKLIELQEEPPYIENIVFITRHFTRLFPLA